MNLVRNSRLSSLFLSVKSIEEDIKLSSGLIDTARG